MTGGHQTAAIGGTVSVPPPGWARVSDLILARIRGRAIDDKILNGEVTDGNPVIIVRRARLISRGYRSAVATALRKLVSAARQPNPNIFVAEIPLRADEIVDSRALILTLADELENEQTVSPRGVILADRLITDGDSPVYAPLPRERPPEETVESAVKRARAALHLG
jgi:hypothetical protein